MGRHQGLDKSCEKNKQTDQSPAHGEIASNNETNGGVARLPEWDGPEQRAVGQHKVEPPQRAHIREEEYVDQYADLPRVCGWTTSTFSKASNIQMAIQTQFVMIQCSFRKGQYPLYGVNIPSTEGCNGG